MGFAAHRVYLESPPSGLPRQLEGGARLSDARGAVQQDGLSLPVECALQSRAQPQHLRLAVEERLSISLPLFVGRMRNGLEHGEVGIGRGRGREAFLCLKFENYRFKLYY